MAKGDWEERDVKVKRGKEEGKEEEEQWGEVQEEKIGEKEKENGVEGKEIRIWTDGDEVWWEKDEY